MRQSNSKYAKYYNKKYNRVGYFCKEDIRVLLFKKIVLLILLKYLETNLKEQNCKR